MTDEREDPFCCQCQEDFPVAIEPTNWRMGQLRPLKELPKKMISRFGLNHWLEEELHKAHLCGNCYFDMLDRLDDEAGK